MYRIEKELDNYVRSQILESLPEELKGVRVQRIATMTNDDLKVKELRNSLRLRYIILFNRHKYSSRRRDLIMVDETYTAPTETMCWLGINNYVRRHLPVTLEAAVKYNWWATNWRDSHTYDLT